MTQLSFDLPLRSAHGRADFFVSDANAMALAMLDRPDHWPQGKLIILGPQGSGKSHLLDIWCNDHAGQTWDINDDQLPPDGAHIAVDDVDQWAGQPDAETKLFHIHNHILATKGRLLLALSHPVGAAGFV
ncbi:MAG: chromosomal replication initiator DnaA, partial [Pseudomonadota bacterium]